MKATPDSFAAAWSRLDAEVGQLKRLSAEVCQPGITSVPAVLKSHARRQSDANRRAIVGLRTCMAPQMTTNTAHSSLVQIPLLSRQSLPTLAVITSDVEPCNSDAASLALASTATDSQLLVSTPYVVSSCLVENTPHTAVSECQASGPEVSRTDDIGIETVSDVVVSGTDEHTDVCLTAMPTADVTTVSTCQQVRSCEAASRLCVVADETALAASTRCVQQPGTPAKSSRAVTDASKLFKSPRRKYGAPRRKVSVEPRAGGAVNDASTRLTQVSASSLSASSTTVDFAAFVEKLSENSALTQKIAENINCHLLRQHDAVASHTLTSVTNVTSTCSPSMTSVGNQTIGSVASASHFVVSCGKQLSATSNVDTLHSSMTDADTPTRSSLTCTADLSINEESLMSALEEICSSVFVNDVSSFADLSSILGKDGSGMEHSEVDQVLSALGSSLTGPQTGKPSSVMASRSHSTCHEGFPEMSEMTESAVLQTVGTLRSESSSTLENRPSVLSSASHEAQSAVSRHITDVSCIASLSVITNPTASQSASEIYTFCNSNQNQDDITSLSWSNRHCIVTSNVPSTSTPLYPDHSIVPVSLTPLMDQLTSAKSVPLSSSCIVNMEEKFAVHHSSLVHVSRGVMTSAELPQSASSLRVDTARVSCSDRDKLRLIPVVYVDSDGLPTCYEVVEHVPSPSCPPCSDDGSKLSSTYADTAAASIDDTAERHRSQPDMQAEGIPPCAGDQPAHSVSSTSAVHNDLPQSTDASEICVAQVLASLSASSEKQIRRTSRRKVSSAASLSTNSENLQKRRSSRRRKLSSVNTSSETHSPPLACRNSDSSGMRKGKNKQTNDRSKAKVSESAEAGVNVGLSTINVADISELSAPVSSSPASRFITVNCSRTLGNVVLSPSVLCPVVTSCGQPNTKIYHRPMKQPTDARIAFDETSGRFVQTVTKSSDRRKCLGFPGYQPGADCGNLSAKSAPVSKKTKTVRTATGKTSRGCLSMRNANLSGVSLPNNVGQSATDLPSMELITKCCLGETDTSADKRSLLSHSATSVTCSVQSSTSSTNESTTTVSLSVTETTCTQSSTTVDPPCEVNRHSLPSIKDFLELASETNPQTSCSSVVPLSFTLSRVVTQSSNSRDAPDAKSPSEVTHVNGQQLDRLSTDTAAGRSAENSDVSSAFTSPSQADNTSCDASDDRSPAAKKPRLSPGVNPNMISKFMKLMSTEKRDKILDLARQCHTSPSSLPTSPNVSGAGASTN